MKNIIIFILIISLFSCGRNSQENAATQVVQKTPLELRKELLLKEQGNPKVYLKYEGTWRKNFIGESVLEGTISNTATLANFKDVILNITWTTKTNTELKTEQKIVYEFLSAGKSIDYKIKVKAPSETGGARVNINSATAVK